MTSRGSRKGRHQVVVANRGNASSEVAVTAEDPDARLRLMVQPPQSVVAPDAKVAFAIRVDVDDPFPFGPERQRPFQVSVTAGPQAPIALRGVLTQRPGLPGWIPPVAGVIGLVALLSIGAFLAKAGPFAPGATPTPSIAQASAPPSAAAPSQPPSEAAGRPSRPQPAPDRRGVPAAAATTQPTAPKQGDPVRGLRARGHPACRSDPATVTQREPLITFRTVGPGDVVLDDDPDYEGGDPNVATPCGCAWSPTAATVSCQEHHRPRARSPRTNDQAGDAVVAAAFARPTRRRTAPRSLKTSR